jgi:IS5 family transposase
MLLIGYLFNIKSERQIEKEIQVNLAYRWFIKYTIDERIPDHTTISQTRRRKFSNSTLFQDIFDEIVNQCIEKDLIVGETLLTDSTHIKANASMESLHEVVISPKEFIDQLDMNIENTERNKDNKKSKENLKGGNSNKISNDTHRSFSDPESRLFTRKGKPKGLFYLEHRTIDESGFITDAHITPGNILDNKPYLKRIERQIETFQFKVRNVVADKAYGTGEIYRELHLKDIQAFIPRQNRGSNRDGMYRREDFIYDGKNDHFICPDGHILERSNKGPTRDDNNVYSGKKSFCNSACVHREKCLKTKNKNTIKTITRSIYQDFVEIQLNKKKTPVWKMLLRKRKSLLEGSFADAKNNHGLRRARFRGMQKVQEQSLMTATVQNIKKMIKEIKRMEQAASQVLTPFINLNFLFIF